MIKVVLADDSPFLRQVLKDILQESSKISVIGEARNGKEAIEIVQRLKPDILILDCEMPVMNGLEALRRIMDESPLPVFMFSSLTFEGSTVTLKALEYGAVDFLLKPTKGAHGIQEVQQELIRKIEHIGLRGKYRKLSSISSKPIEPEKKVSIDILSRSHYDLIAIGSSTGGVQAAVEVVQRLPAKCKPIVWVQHMPPNFTKSFANRLDAISKIRVKEAEHSEKIEENTCYVAKGGSQMRVKKLPGGYSLDVSGEEKVSGHCPSCNVLFESISQHFSNNALGVILTGMGDDGTKGLVAMHRRGAFVIGQNESSCVVYGMPKAAHQAGAVNIELDITDIAGGIIKKGAAG